MDWDVEGHLGAVERSVSSRDRDGLPARAVIVSRSYATTVEDLWDAVTNAQRILRWFLPISGTLESGGRYQLEGNAGGVIAACEQPSHLALTWEFGVDVSWVEIRLSDDRVGRARIVLTHTAHLSEHWEEYGPGAAGVGWELGLLGLAIHLAQPTAPPPDWSSSVCRESAAPTTHEASQPSHRRPTRRGSPEHTAIAHVIPRQLRHQLLRTAQNIRASSVVNRS